MNWPQTWPSWPLYLNVSALKIINFSHCHISCVSDTDEYYSISVVIVNRVVRMFSWNRCLWHIRNDSVFHVNYKFNAPSEYFYSLGWKQSGPTTGVKMVYHGWADRRGRSFNRTEFIQNTTSRYGSLTWGAQSKFSRTLNGKRRRFSASWGPLAHFRQKGL